jgi:hypothetical protein
MASVINVTAGGQAILTLANTEALSLPGATNGMVIPLMQDVTVNASPGTVRYSTLDSSSSSAFTTTNENSISLNMLLDEETFFGLASAGGLNLTADTGLFNTSKNKTETFFTVAFEGTDSTDYYIKGKGFIGGIAASASIDQAVWISPMEITVNGELTPVKLT